MGTQRIKLKRGLKENLPTSGMLAGEPLITTDRGTLHVATDAETRIPVVPAIDDLTVIAAIDPAADLVMIHDASETIAQKEKQATIAVLKAALNSPAGSSDEKVAVVSGGTSGYLYGTDGTDGVLRMSTGLKMTKDAGNGFVTIDVEIVDGGTF